MKNIKNIKDGFTVIELLATIVIIGIISLITIPIVINNIVESREDLYNNQIENIKLSAKKWATENRKQLDPEYINDTFISVKMLIDLGLLSEEKISDPLTKNEINGCVKISYDMSNKIYKYEYQDENLECKDTSKKGYYYKYLESTNSWDKILTYQKQSIYSYLVGEEESNIVASGNGLYDMEDRYVFRGRAENNYVLLDGTLFRIISLDKNTKSLKLISHDKIGSGIWGKTTNISLNATTLYTEVINKPLYESVINKNVKWNIGKITNTNNLNLNAVKAYESTSQIESNIAIISMSEYMEASIDATCSNGVLESCGNETYLNIADSWTMTTTDNQVIYVNNNKGLSYETDLVNKHHNIHRVLNVKALEKKGAGTQGDPFVITTES